MPIEAVTWFAVEKSAVTVKAVGMTLGRSAACSTMSRHGQTMWYLSMSSGGRWVFEWLSLMLP